MEETWLKVLRDLELKRVVLFQNQWHLFGKVRDCQQYFLMIVFCVHVSFDALHLEVEVFSIEKIDLNRLTREFLFQLELNITADFLANSELRKIYLVFSLLQVNHWCCNMQEDLQSAPLVVLFVPH